MTATQQKKNHLFKKEVLKIRSHRWARESDQGVQRSLESAWDQYYKENSTSRGNSQIRVQKIVQNDNLFIEDIPKSSMKNYQECVIALIKKNKLSSWQAYIHTYLRFATKTA